MSKDTLALLGGQPAINRPLELFNSVGEAEADAAAEVIRGGVLSAYIGAPGEGFMGGPRVRAFEAQAAKYFGVKHAIVVNSWTSGLIAAVGAIGIEPGDEIITTPWTMAATATAILHFNGIPVFADIDPVTFNISPASVEKLITPRTRAIMAVDIFGQSADMKSLREIADRHGLKLLCDTAQAPGARADGAYAGTLADIGGYSLNYHKHIHCGEGGILVTNDDWLAKRLCLIRNHAEAVIRSDDPAELANMLGYNFRMGEIEAAIASVQLEKLAPRVASRQRAARELDAGLGGLRGLRTPALAEGATHVYYVYGMTLDIDALGVSRDRIVEALRAEGVPALVPGYQNLHLLPLFRNKIAYGRRGFPWNSPYCSREINYGPGLCPVAEELHARSFLGINLCMYEYHPEDVELIVSAFRKVWSNLSSL
ncbi:DegT/DnrJ/EryC1/StrS family aminotransferase [Noviherbaspirillum aridicola]|uniref:Aminotransferase DegT n=1 Tax=Noviherbaspirillum aridicola TaxID=2849687 RepID=A0ABQ4Q2N7_9BURK|nr:DegT/DnrJ/EryC1/StrS family aminotransferase [Noviherbaspirillum aridicola]GIZ51296.1 aminotransferase DegT [Noviherbaspirillum aridicola]